MADVLDRARVLVDGEEIPAATIAAEAQNHPAQDADAAWNAGARALVVRHLLLREADRLGVTTDRREDAEGRVLADDDARIDALLSDAVRVPEATIEEAQRFYDRNLARFMSETLVEAEHILIAANPADELAYGLAVGDARTLIRRLQSDPSAFADCARKHSACPSKEQGGNLGQIGKGQTVPPFEQALFALGEGELCAEPVRSPYGVHVVRAGRRIEGRQLPFDAVQATICDYLEEASTRRAMTQYLSILAGKASIEGVELPQAEGLLVQ